MLDYAFQAASEIPCSATDQKLTALGITSQKCAVRFALLLSSSIKSKVCCPQCVAASRVLPIVT